MDTGKISNTVDKTKIPLKRSSWFNYQYFIGRRHHDRFWYFSKNCAHGGVGAQRELFAGGMGSCRDHYYVGAFTIAGLSNLTTESGGVYEYLRISFGDFVSFLYGWTAFTIIGSASVAALAFIFSQSVNSLIHLHDPFNYLKNISVGNFMYPFDSSGVKLLSIATIILLTWLNYRGTKKGASLNSFLTWLKITGILCSLRWDYFFTNSSQEPVMLTPVNAVSNAAIFSAFFELCSVLFGHTMAGPTWLS